MNVHWTHNGLKFCISATKMLKNGNELYYDMLTKIPTMERCRICDAQGQFYGVYLLQREKKAVKPWKMFFPEEG